MASHNFACLCVCVWDPFLLSSFLVFQFSLEDHHHARKLRLWSLLGLFVMPVLKVLANEILLCVLASRLLVKSFLEFQTSLRKWSGVTWRKEGKVWSICFPGTKKLLLVTGICFWCCYVCGRILLTKPSLTSLLLFLFVVDGWVPQILRGYLAKSCEKYCMKRRERDAVNEQVQ
jgi:hypothetical protein